MTVKLTNFFSSNAASISHPTTTPSTTMTGALAPPTPPITHATAATTAITGSYHLHQQQPQQLQQQSYKPYLVGHVDVETVDDDGDLYDDDNMSLYSNATSASGIMTQRGHSCNNSQRPLLGERKPPKMLLLSNNNGTKKNKKLTASSSSSSSANGINQPQRHLLHKQRQQGKPQMLQQSKSYISPYVQQQKRDSAKGLHGFNDFDILSQQYTEHLRSSPHIGYPYGSPPSPTAKSNDFVFDTLIMPQKRQQQQQQPQQQQSSSQQIVENDIIDTDYSYYARTTGNGNASNNSSSGSGSGSASVGSLGHMTTNNNATPPYQYIGKPSRFEDDFCTRRNASFAAPQNAPTLQQSQQQQPLATAEDSWLAADDIGGPFIFGGVPHERFSQDQLNGDNMRQQQQTLPLQRDSNNSLLALTAKSTNSALDVSGKYSPYIAQVIVSSSDTSSSSRDSSSNKGAKFLLRKGKSKRNTKDKKSESSVVQAKAQQPKKKQETPSIKCVLVGDGAVGKTNLILSYLKNRFNTEHVPTASDIYNADVLVNDSPVRLTICDTAGQDTLDKLRQLCYPDSDVFLLCFSVVKPDTFNAVKTKWAPKFSKTKAVLLLVGTQADLRNDAQVLNKLQLNGEKPISYADAWDLAAIVGAKYIETSSATQDKVKEVFDTAIWEGLAPTTLPPTPTPPLWKKLLCLA
ncbi:LOW QUALITY PROTEIN: uncharacterized protein RhoU [Eurosta solidaginis]|uniref:LOW QUALITY PROTEIN: uncharacterized protein RhoU n=1 Tax=Eurosta solidaginis TaxID=178769 RepID=UPI003531772E